MTADELLRELRPVEIPGEPDWWLLAPFGQLMLALAAGAIAVFWLYRRQRRRNRKFDEASRRLEQIRQQYRRHADSRATLQALSAWLRQVAMAAFPEPGIAALCGRAWSDFLRRSTAVPIFEAQLQRLFSIDVYRESVDLDLNPAIDACERWLAAVSDRLRQSGGRNAAV